MTGFALCKFFAVFHPSCSSIPPRASARVGPRTIGCTPTGAAVRLCNKRPVWRVFSSSNCQEKGCICNDFLPEKIAQKMQKRNQVKLILVFLPRNFQTSKNQISQCFSGGIKPLIWRRPMELPWGSTKMSAPDSSSRKKTTAESLVTRTVFCWPFCGRLPGGFGSPTSGEIVQHHFFFLQLEIISTNFGRYPREI